MLHILLTIIKIPFILLAVVLILLLLIMLLVSFVPLRYKAVVKKGEGLYASGTVTWLMHFISVCFEYSDKQARLRLKLAGFPLIGGKTKKKRQKKLPEEEEAVQDAQFPEADSETVQEPESVEERDETSEASEVLEDEDEASEKLGVPENGDVIPTEREMPENISAPDEDGDSSAAEDAHSCKETDAAVDKSRGHGNIFKKIICKIKDAVLKIREVFGHLSKTATDIKSKLDYYRRLWYDEHTQSAWRHLKKEVFCLLRHYRPRKANGQIRFGFEDPALTGQLLGVLCILQALSGNNLIAEADFEQKMFEGDFTLKGHIRVCHFLRAALALVFDKHCRITFKRIRKLL